MSSRKRFLQNYGYEGPRKKPRFDAKTDWVRPNVIIQIGDADEEEVPEESSSINQNWIRPDVIVEIRDADEEDQRSDSGYSSLELSPELDTSDSNERSSVSSEPDHMLWTPSPDSQCTQPSSESLPKPVDLQFSKHGSTPIRDDMEASQVDEFLRRIDAGREMPCLICPSSFTKYKLLEHICDVHFAQYRPYKCGQCHFRTGQMDVLRFVHALEARHKIGARKVQICGKRNENAERVIQMMHQQCNKEITRDFIDRVRECAPRRAKEVDDSLIIQIRDADEEEVPEESSRINQNWVRPNVIVEIRDADDDQDRLEDRRSDSGYSSLQSLRTDPVQITNSDRKTMRKNLQLKKKISKVPNWQLTAWEQYSKSISRLRQVFIRNGLLELDSQE